jgi:hypothetical protein
VLAFVAVTDDNDDDDVPMANNGARTVVEGVAPNSDNDGTDAAGVDDDDKEEEEDEDEPIENKDNGAARLAVGDATDTGNVVDVGVGVVIGRGRDSDAPNRLVGTVLVLLLPFAVFAVGDAIGAPFSVVFGAALGNLNISGVAPVALVAAAVVVVAAP